MARVCACVRVRVLVGGFRLRVLNHIHTHTRHALFVCVQKAAGEGGPRVGKLSPLAAVGVTPVPPVRVI